MESGKKNLLIGSGVIMAGITAVGAVSHALTKELVKLAVDRECPRRITARAREQFKGSEENSAFAQAAALAARKLKSGGSVSVEMTARDGERLAGHWLPCGDPKRIVLAMHGWRSCWYSDFGMISDFFRENGCSVLYAEQRGQGGSGGEYMGLGALERYDCLDWIEWINANVNPGLPVYLGGVSMGATTVLMAAGLGLPENVHGIVADCGFTSPHEIGRHIVKNNLHMSFGLRGNVADALCRKKNRVGTKGCSAVDALKENRVPVLFIHGADDRFVPVTMTYDNYRACKGPKELLIVPGADHGMSYYVDPKRYETALKSFWEKYD